MRNGFSTFLLWTLCALVILVFGGCVSHRTATPRATYPEMLSFIQDGTTTRADFQQKMGEPRKVFLEGKVWIYFLGLKAAADTNQNRIVVCQPFKVLKDQDAVPAAENLGPAYETEAGADCTKYHLVASFDEVDVLQKHSLIQIR